MANKEHVELQLVVFMLGGEEFGVDIAQVREIIRVPAITRMPNAPAFVEGVINLRGKVTPVMDLRGRLGMKASQADDGMRIVIVELGKDSIGMIVDSVSEVRRLSSSDIEPPPSITSKIGSEYIRGVGKLESRLLILLDLNRVLSLKEEKHLERMASKIPA
jgi:purine-binding chemotaxis protein CheW